MKAMPRNMVVGPAGGLGLAGHGLDGLADEVADADARADGREAVGETGAGGAGAGP